MDLPDVIIDENGYMEKVLEKIPRLRSIFTKKGDAYYLKGLAN